jgi:hypothetical protein
VFSAIISDYFLNLQEAVGDTLEELWISYNLIEKVKGVNALKKLRVLYMSNNLVKDWAEFNKLQDMPNLQDLLFVGLYFFILLSGWPCLFLSEEFPCMMMPKAIIYAVSHTPLL